MLNELAKNLHENAKEKGFWDNIDYCLQFADIITEVSEAVRARRINKYSNYELYEKIDAGFREAFETFIKDTFQDEVADIFIMLLSISYHFQIDLEDREGLESYSVNTDSVYGMLNTVSYYIGKVSRHVTGKDTVEVAYIEREIKKAVITVETLADVCGTKLEWHVLNKIVYNAGREHLHGKQF